MTERVARVAVSAIVQRDDTVLLVQRGRGHALGKWAVPGGHVAFGEPLADAVEREVFEETGLRVRVERFAGFVERIGDDPQPYHLVILDFFASELDQGGMPQAGDDASDVQWVPLAALGEVDLVDGLFDFLVSVGVGHRTSG